MGGANGSRVRSPKRYKPYSRLYLAPAETDPRLAGETIAINGVIEYGDAYVLPESSCVECDFGDVCRSESQDPLGYDINEL